jgi:phage regulator Rha-like protein
VVLRRQRVLLDSDLAALYGVTTQRLNEQVRRNLTRFPNDFLFRSTPTEHAAFRSQFATSSRSRRQHPKYLPYAITEHGAIMAATILNSARAIEISVYVVRTFVQLRDLLSSSKELAARFDELERKLDTHDQAIVGILKTIREIMNPPIKRSWPIGFTATIDEK